LARWLRMIGFDTAHEPGIDNRCLMRTAQEEQRILLTRIAAVWRAYKGEMVFIRSDHWRKQLRQVIGACGVPGQRFTLFSRCTKCNEPVIPIDKESVVGKFPDYVHSTQDLFHMCPTCRRIFWKGTHSRNVMAIMDSITWKAPNAS